MAAALRVVYRYRTWRAYQPQSGELKAQAKIHVLAVHARALVEPAKAAENQARSIQNAALAESTRRSGRRSMRRRTKASGVGTARPLSWAVPSGFRSTGKAQPVSSCLAQLSSSVHTLGSDRAMSGFSTQKYGVPARAKERL